MSANYKVKILNICARRSLSCNLLVSMDITACKEEDQLLLMAHQPSVTLSKDETCIYMLIYMLIWKTGATVPKH